MDVCSSGIKEPDSSSSPPGLPGSTSTNRLPSRKRRGRRRIAASSLIGRPSSSMLIVTTAASSPLPSSSVRCSTDFTFPTSTPAIRTGLLARMLWASEKTARSS